MDLLLIGGINTSGPAHSALTTQVFVIHLPPLSQLWRQTKAQTGNGPGPSQPEVFAPCIPFITGLTGYDSMNGLSSTSHSLFSKDSPKHSQKSKLLSALTRLVWDFFHDKLLTCHLAHWLRYPSPLVHERKQAVLR